MRETIYYLFGSDVGSYLIEGNYISIAAVCAAAVLLLCIILAAFSAGKNRRLEEISHQKHSGGKSRRRVFIDEDAPQNAKNARDHIRQKPRKYVPIPDVETAVFEEPMPELGLAERPDTRRGKRPDDYAKPVITAIPVRPVEIAEDELPDRQITGAGEMRNFDVKEPESMKHELLKKEKKTDRVTVPPVDERPGMIPNPMKMPDVPVRSGMDYDVNISDDDDYDIK